MGHGQLLVDAVTPRMLVAALPRMSVQTFTAQCTFWGDARCTTSLRVLPQISHSMTVSRAALPMLLCLYVHGDALIWT